MCQCEEIKIFFGWQHALQFPCLLTNYSTCIKAPLTILKRRKDCCIFCLLWIKEKFKRCLHHDFQEIVKFNQVICIWRHYSTVLEHKARATGNYCPKWLDIFCLSFLFYCRWIQLQLRQLQNSSNITKRTIYRSLKIIQQNVWNAQFKGKKKMYKPLSQRKYEMMLTNF